MVYEFYVDGMMCENCKKHVVNAMMELDGVTGVAVNLESKLVSVTADNEIAEEVFVNTIEEEGYSYRKQIKDIYFCTLMWQNRYIEVERNLRNAYYRCIRKKL